MNRPICWNAPPKDRDTRFANSSTTAIIPASAAAYSTQLNRIKPIKAVSHVTNKCVKLGLMQSKPRFETKQYVVGGYGAPKTNWTEHQKMRSFILNLLILAISAPGTPKLKNWHFLQTVLPTPLKPKNRIKWSIIALKRKFAYIIERKTASVRICVKVTSVQFR